MSEWTVWVTGHGSFTVNADDADEAQRDGEALARYGAGFASIEWHEVEVSEVTPTPVVAGFDTGNEEAS